MAILLLDNLGDKILIDADELNKFDTPRDFWIQDDNETIIAHIVRLADNIFGVYRKQNYPWTYILPYIVERLFRKDTLVSDLHYFNLTPHFEEDLRIAVNISVA